MIKCFLIVAGLIAFCAVAAFVAFILFFHKKSKQIEKELREDGYYDLNTCRQYRKLYQHHWCKIKANAETDL